MWHKLAVRFCTEELFNSRGIEPLELSTNKAVQYYPKNYFLIASLREFTVRHFWTTSRYSNHTGRQASPAQCAE